MAQAGLNSPIEQALAQYQAQVDAGFNALQPGYTAPEKLTPADITVYCGGSLGDVSCQPPSQAAWGSLAFHTNLLYPGLRPGDVPAGSMANGVFQGNAALWQQAYYAGEAAFIGTGVVLAGVPAAPYVPTILRAGSTLGRTLFYDPAAWVVGIDIYNVIMPPVSLPTTWPGFGVCLAVQCWDPNP